MGSDIEERTNKLEEAVLASLVEGYLPCPVGLGLSKKLGVGTGDIGDTVDTLGIRVTDCQLGCFKVEKALHDDLDGRVFSQDVLENIKNSLEAGYLPCKTAHELGRELKVNLKEIGDAATSMKIKISNCQLGCFV